MDPTSKSSLNQSSHDPSALPGQNNPVQSQKEKSQTWGEWTKQKTSEGFTAAFSAAVGWQASAVVSAWAPKIILDAAIAKAPIMGGLFYGPAAVEAAKPVITYLAWGTGAVTTYATSVALVGIATLGVKGVNAVNAKLEERATKNAMRDYQLNPANKKDFGVIAVDDWSELETSQEKVDQLKAQLQKETKSDIRINLRAEIGRLEGEIALEKFRETL